MSINLESDTIGSTNNAALCSRDSLGFFSLEAEGFKGITSLVSEVDRRIMVVPPLIFIMLRSDGCGGTTRAKQATDESSFRFIGMTTLERPK